MAREAAPTFSFSSLGLWGWCGFLTVVKWESEDGKTNKTKNAKGLCPSPSSPLLTNFPAELWRHFLQFTVGTDKGTKQLLNQLAEFLQGALRGGPKSLETSNHDSEKKSLLLWVHEEIYITTYVLGMHQKPCNIAPFFVGLFCLYFCSARKNACLRCIKYLDDLFSFPQLSLKGWAYWSSLCLDLYRSFTFPWAKAGKLTGVSPTPNPTHFVSFWASHPTDLWFLVFSNFYYWNHALMKSRYILIK